MLEFLAFAGAAYALVGSVISLAKLSSFTQDVNGLIRLYRRDINPEMPEGLIRACWFMFGLPYIFGWGLITWPWRVVEPFASFPPLKESDFKMSLVDGKLTITPKDKK